MYSSCVYTYGVAVTLYLAKGYSRGSIYNE